MTPEQIEGILDQAEAAVTTGESIGNLGFWSVVSAVKRDDELTDRFADRIAEIDQAALKAWALLTVPLWIGNVLMITATLAGITLVGWAYSLDGTWAALVFLAGLGALLVTTHGLGHLLVGGMLGMRFTMWFIGEPTRPQPGVKVDYSSYLRSPATSRAWMHASGAITTKLIPFLLLGAAFAADLPAWVPWAVVVVGLASIVTDVVWSTKASDWKKFRREMEFAQSS